MTPKRAKLRIGVCSDLDDKVFQQLLSELLRCAAQDNDLLLCDCRVSTFCVGDPPWKGRVDGVLLAMGLTAGTSCDDFARWVRRGGVPAVSTAADVLHPQIPVICTSMESVARLAADHLAACGCRSFLHVGYALSMGSRRRAEALGKLLARRGLAMETFDFTPHEPGQNHRAHLALSDQALASLLRSLPKPVGVLAVNDGYARKVRNICDSARLAVPGQVAIVGVGDMPPAFAEPTITSIDYPRGQIARQAIVLIRQLIGGGRRPRKPLEIPAAKIFVRKSTSESSDDRDDLGRALDLIGRQACDGLTVAALARSLSVSRRWLELAFHEHLGRSPLQEIQRVRLFKAQQLLQLTDISITKITGMVGFSTPSILSDFFRRLTGTSPTEYRDWAHRYLSAPGTKAPPG